MQGVRSPGGPVNPIWRLAKKDNLDTTYNNETNLITYDRMGIY